MFFLKRKGKNLVSPIEYGDKERCRKEARKKTVAVITTDSDYGLFVKGIGLLWLGSQGMLFGQRLFVRKKVVIKTGNFTLDTWIRMNRMRRY